MTEKTLKKALAAVMLIFLALVSFFLVGEKTMKPDAHAVTIASLDDKAQTVLKLTATSTVASACISAIPDDTATPIAEKLADFTEDFLLILCVLYAEKYLVTIIGAGTFKVLIPCACVLFGVGMYWKPEIMKRLAIKFAIFGLAIFITIPMSIRVSDMIYDNYSDSIDETITAAEEFTDSTSELTEAEDGDEGLLASILSRISETAAGLADKAAELLKNFVESLAVLIVTSCVIPVLVLVFFVWLIKMVTGIEISIPTGGGRKKGPKAKVSNVTDAMG